MSEIAIEIILQAVKTELKNRNAVDIYDLAKTLSGYYPDLAPDKLAELIASVVASEGGAALWEKKTP